MEGLEDQMCNILQETTRVFDMQTTVCQRDKLSIYMSAISLASSARMTRLRIKLELSAISAVNFCRTEWYSSTWNQDISKTCIHAAFPFIETCAFMHIQIPTTILIISVTYYQR